MGQQQPKVTKSYKEILEGLRLQASIIQAQVWRSFIHASFCQKNHFIYIPSSNKFPGSFKNASTFLENHNSWFLNLHESAHSHLHSYPFGNKTYSLSILIFCSTFPPLPQLLSSPATLSVISLYTTHWLAHFNNELLLDMILHLWGTIHYGLFYLWMLLWHVWLRMLIALIISKLNVSPMVMSCFLVIISLFRCSYWICLGISFASWSPCSSLQSINPVLW